MLSNTEFKDILKAESEVRPDMSYNEWADLCRSAGVAHTDDEVASTLRSYSDAGVVLHFQERVYLQPKEIAESILSVRTLMTQSDNPVSTQNPTSTKNHCLGNQQKPLFCYLSWCAVNIGSHRRFVLISLHQTTQAWANSHCSCRSWRSDARLPSPKPKRANF